MLCFPVRLHVLENKSWFRHTFVEFLLLGGGLQTEVMVLKGEANLFRVWIFYCQILKMNFKFEDKIVLKFFFKYY